MGQHQFDVKNAEKAKRGEKRPEKELHAPHLSTEWWKQLE